MPVAFLFFDFFSKWFRDNNPDKEPSSEENQQEVREIDEFAQNPTFDGWDQMGQIPKTPASGEDEPITDPDLPTPRRHWWQLW